MSNLTRLQAVSSSLDTAIDKAENLPDAGGGGSVDTCTVTLTADNGKIKGYLFTVFENGAITAKNSLGTTNEQLSTPITVSNVVCGSAAVIYATYSLPGYTITNATMEEWGTFYGARTFKLAAENGSNVVINCYNND